LTFCRSLRDRWRRRPETARSERPVNPGLHGKPRVNSMRVLTAPRLAEDSCAATKMPRASE
jgi:hypothetical protein